MFNVYAYDQKLKDRKLKEKEAIRALTQRQTFLKNRKKLSENYDHRIKQFMIAMIKEPQKVTLYQSPLEIAGRITDPSKYKGSASIILKGYKSERQRILENLQNEQFIKSNPVTPMEITPKLDNIRMYFKPRTNLERIKDELQQRHVNIAELEGERIKPPPKNKTKPSTSKAETQGTTVHKEEDLTPKQIFASLHNKTYFKAVKTVQTRSTSSLGTPTSLNPKILEGVKKAGKGLDLKPEELTLLAGEALRYCNVEDSPNNYLKVGQGKLVSNPDMTVLETYQVLNRLH